MAEREWREAVDMRPSSWALGAVLATAVLLRFWNLSHGVPYAVAVDEPDIMDRVLRMMRTGDFNPHFFDYPSLYFYVQLVVACVRYLSGATGGRWYALDQVSVGDFFVWARGVTAILGAATVLIVYFVGMRWGARHALLGAGLMAVIPMHVRESHYVLTDVPMTFFVALTLLLSLRAHERGSIASFVWAGGAAGLAAATKYNGVLALFMPLCAAYAAPAGAAGARLARAQASAAACVAAFLVTAPYTVLDLPAFLNAYGSLASHYKGAARSVDPGWLVYLKHLRIQLAWPGFLFAAVGLVLAIARAFTGPGHVRYVLLTLFPVLYFYLVATRTLVFARYLLPIVPFVCLMAAIAVISGVSLLRRFDIPRKVRTGLIAAGTVAALLPPLADAVLFDRNLGTPTTQEQAFVWIRDNVPPGTRVVVESRVLLLPEERYQVEHVRSIADHDVASFRSERVDYAVASSSVYGIAMSAPQGQPVLYRKYRAFFDETEQVFIAAPSEDVKGPEIRVLKLGAP